MRTVVTSSATAMSTSVQVITESGAVVTRTVIYQPSEAASQSQSSSGGPSNTGAIVGGVVGGVAAIAAIVGGILFFLWRRRKQQREAAQEHQAGITRNTSTMSKAGLLGGRSVATDPHHPPPIATNLSNAGSRHDVESISPISGSQRRYSQPMMIDSRLNPETVLMYHPTFGNSSRDSLGSIDDSRDFGRQLNVSNVSIPCFTTTLTTFR